MKTKFYWHIHHTTLMEPLTEPIKNRIAFIKSDKPKHERKTRLRLMKPVKGKLPVKLIEARDAHYEARDAYDKARDAYKPQVEKLHAKECPNCPWDGTTIFPKDQEV